MTENERAKWLLLGRKCSNCIYFFDLHEYRARYGSDVIEHFGGVDSLCRNEERIYKMELKNPPEDGQLAIPQPPNDFVCEYWVPKQQDIKNEYDREIYEKAIKNKMNRSTISEDEIANIAKDLKL